MTAPEIEQYRDNLRDKWHQTKDAELRYAINVLAAAFKACLHSEVDAGMESYLKRRYEAIMRDSTPVEQKPMDAVELWKIKNNVKK